MSLTSGLASGAVATPAGAPARGPVVLCPPRLLDLVDAGRYLGVSTWTIRDYLAKGLLHRVALPAANERSAATARGEIRRVLIDRGELDALADRSPKT